MACCSGLARLGTGATEAAIHTCMRPIALRILTWATAAAAVLSALWLSAVDSDAVAALRQAGARSAPTSTANWPGLVR